MRSERDVPYPRAGSRRAVVSKGRVVKRELEFDSLLAPSEVPRLFAVDPKTVTRWARAGRLASVRTPAGHRRYRESEVRGLIGADELDAMGTLTPSEVARLFGVDPKTVTRWAR